MPGVLMKDPYVPSQVKSSQVKSQCEGSASRLPTAVGSSTAPTAILLPEHIRISGMNYVRFLESRCHVVDRHCQSLARQKAPSPPPTAASSRTASTVRFFATPTAAMLSARGRPTATRARSSSPRPSGRYIAVTTVRCRRRATTGLNKYNLPRDLGATYRY